MVSSPRPYNYGWGMIKGRGEYRRIGEVSGSAYRGAVFEKFFHDFKNLFYPIILGVGANAADIDYSP
jgi:hypothetical protein